jgi:RHS repeat-associated protein
VLFRDSVGNPLSSTYAYDKVGNLQSVTYPNGVVHTYTYDARNRLTNLAVNNSAAPMESYAYTLDAAGHRLSVSELSGRTVNYGYDNLYRLTGETVASDPHGINGAVNYIYDPVGNRKQMTSTLAPVPAGLWNYDANDRFTAGDTYDSNGNTASSGGIANVYDFENHLIQKGGATIVYDGDGNRVSKKVAGVTTTYLVDTLNPTGYAQVIYESFSGGTAGNREQNHNYVYGLELISQVRSYQASFNNFTQRIYYVYDGHGSVRALTDPTGAVTDTYDYDAFGNLIRSSTTLSSPTLNNYLFAGEQFDPDLNLYYNRARYLNTTIGRFWSMDTYEGNDEDPQSLHKYLYAENNPANSTDPSGRQIDDILATAAFSVGLGATIGGGLGYYISGTTKGAAFGALGGGLIGLTFAFGSPKQKVDVVLAGTSNAAFQAFANYFTNYYDDLLNIPPPIPQQENELIVEAFAAGTTNALIGTTLGLSGGGGAAFSAIGNAVTTAYFQGRSLRSALPSAIVGALTGYIGSGIQMPGGNDVGLYAIGKIITAATLKTISTAGTPVLKAVIQALDPNLYNLLYGQ